MQTRRISSCLLALASVASVGHVYGQQTQTPGINQRDSAATTTRPEAHTKMQTGGMPLKQVIVHKLLKANDGEIELANLAMQRSENQEVQQYAKMLVQDHQALNQKLQSMRDSSIPATRTSGTTAAANSARSTDGTPAGANANRSRRDTPATTEGRDVTNRPQADGQANAARSQGSRSADGNMVPQQLTQMMDQACDTSLKMTKEMLQNYQGQDFAMAFLGQQTVAHTMQLAELQAIQSHGPEELKEIAQEAAGKVQQHLEQAKQLAKKLEDDRKTTRAAAR